MPVYIEIANIVIEKQTIQKKYKGGIRQFKIDYSFGEGKLHKEDDELLLLAYMNLFDSDIRYLINKGLQHDEVNQSSNDFAILYMYGGDTWKVDWLDSNAAFAWHKKCDPKQIEQAQKIGNSYVDDIKAAIDRGENPFQTIKSKFLRMRENEDNLPHIAVERAESAGEYGLGFGGVKIKPSYQAGGLMDIDSFEDVVYMTFILQEYGNRVYPYYSELKEFADDFRKTNDFGVMFADNWIDYANSKFRKYNIPARYNLEGKITQSIFNESNLKKQVQLLELSRENFMRT